MTNYVYVLFRYSDQHKKNDGDVIGVYWNWKDARIALDKAADNWVQDYATEDTEIYAVGKEGLPYMVTDGCKIGVWEPDYFFVKKMQIQ